MKKFTFLAGGDAALAATADAFEAAKKAYYADSKQLGMVLAQVTKTETGEVQIEGAFFPFEVAEKVRLAVKEYIDSVAPSGFGQPSQKEG